MSSFDPSLAYYLHDLSPYVIQFSESFKLHWYGLAYVLGFYACYLILRWQARKGLTELKESEAGDFITYTALFGVILGGRLGYMLFYNFQEFTRDPLSLFKIWDGGMASHGGILGIIFFTLYWAKTRKVSWTGLGDALVIGAPLGILFGRCANFINGELYGRISTSPLAVKFPTEVHDPHFIPAKETSLAYENLPRYSNEILETLKSVPHGVEELTAILNPRHASQIYEGLCEGLLLFLILFSIRLLWKSAPNGFLTALFFIFYAISRIICETFREPDSERILSLTKGQFYSVFMIFIGLAFLTYSLTNKSKQNKLTSKKV